MVIRSSHPNVESALAPASTWAAPSAICSGYLSSLERPAGIRTGACRNTVQLHNVFGNHVNIILGLLGDFIEQFVQSNKVRTFHIPMGLVQLQIKINSTCRAFIYQRV